MIFNIFWPKVHLLTVENDELLKRRNLIFNLKWFTSAKPWTKQDSLNGAPKSICLEGDATKLREIKTRCHETKKRRFPAHISFNLYRVPLHRSEMCRTFYYRTSTGVLSIVVLTLRKILSASFVLLSMIFDFLSSSFGFTKMKNLSPKVLQSWWYFLWI